jgi:cell division protein FtsB
MPKKMPKKGPTGARLMRRRFVLAVLSLATVGVVLFTVFPTRTYLHQRKQIENAQKQLALLKDVNNKLAAQSEKLNTDAEIERIARERYGLIKPNEVAYGLLPGSGPSSGSVTHEANPGSSKETLLDRVVDDLVFWR